MNENKLLLQCYIHNVKEIETGKIFKSYNITTENIVPPFDLINDNGKNIIISNVYNKEFYDITNLKCDFVSKGKFKYSMSATMRSNFVLELIDI